MQTIARRTLALALGAAACVGIGHAADSDVPPPGGACPVIEPGKAVGRFSLGTVLKAPEAVTAAELPGWSHPTDPTGRDTLLRFDDQKKLVAFSTPLPRCLTLGGKELRDQTPRQLAVALGTCGPEQNLEGGTRIPCAGVAITSSMGATGLEHRLRMQAEPNADAPKVACDVYFDADGATDATGTKAASGKPATIEVGTRNVCLAGWPQAVNASTRTDDVGKGRSCTTEALRGGTHVRCGTVTFSFAGPAQALHRITVAP